MESGKFSLKRFLLFVTLIAFGLAMLRLAGDGSDLTDTWPFVIAAGAFWGGAVGVILKRTLWGTLIGAAAMLLFIICTGPPEIRD
jgi:hypothetical protein